MAELARLVAVFFAQRVAAWDSVSRSILPTPQTKNRRPKATAVVITAGLFSVTVMGSLRIRTGQYFNRRLLGFERVYFTRHALDRLKARGITREDVCRTIENPDVTGLPTPLNRQRVRKSKTNTYDIDVVYEIAKTIRVITALKHYADNEPPRAPRISRTKRKKKKKQRRKKK